jgi:hypothetical protein
MPQMRLATAGAFGIALPVPRARRAGPSPSATATPPPAYRCDGADPRFGHASRGRALLDGRQGRRWVDGLLVAVASAAECNYTVTVNSKYYRLETVNAGGAAPVSCIALDVACHGPRRPARPFSLATINGSAALRYGGRARGPARLVHERGPQPAARRPARGPRAAGVGTETAARSAPRTPSRYYPTTPPKKIAPRANMGPLRAC